VNAALEQLIALQKAETKIRTLQAEIQAIPKRRADIEKEFEQRAFEVREMEKKRDDARQERARLEKEIAETQSKAERAERNLKIAKNETQYTAAIREADAARKHISQLETQILEKMELIEQTEATLKEHQPEIERLRNEMEANLKAFEEQTKNQTEELEQTKAHREEIYNSMPKNLSTTFNRIATRIRDGIAVAEVRNAACSACFMALRPQMFAEIRRGDEIITCENCNRILYYIADTAQV
jgi:predicted  nucleic acid-binding Zn-ribbon protein